MAEHSATPAQARRGRLDGATTGNDWSATHSPNAKTTQAVGRAARFAAILIDPPWRFAVRSPKGEGRSASQHYACMTLDAVAALPVAEWAAPDAWLFLWATTPLLPQALQVMGAWGFSYSGNAFAWVKQNPSGVGFHTGLGFTTRKNIELCLLGKRGKPRIAAHDVRELIVAPRREHSRKPDEVYGRIERLCSGPYLELFARQQWPGWRALGDEVGRFAQ
jgi:N6-adenosine-specific RNA methylase IME4